MSPVVRTRINRALLSHTRGFATSAADTPCPRVFAAKAHGQMSATRHPASSADPTSRKSPVNPSCAVTSLGVPTAVG